MLFPCTAIAQAPAAKMKLSPFVTSDKSKNREWHFNAPSHIHRKITSSPLSEELRPKYGIGFMPLWKGDEVRVVWGTTKVSKLAKSSRLTERNGPSRWRSAAREGIAQPRGLSLGWTWTKTTKRSLNVRPNLTK